MSEPSAVDYLAVEDLYEIAGGILGEVSLRDAGLLASAAARPAMSVFGDDAYPSFAEKAGALLHSLARNHPLIDGNKRLAWAATRAFCLLNARDLRYTVDDAEAFVQAVAAGDLDSPPITSWIATRLVSA